MTIKPIIAITALLLSATPHAVSANENCASTNDVRAYLVDDFNEVPVMMGRTQDGYLFEIWANTTTQTWTYVLTADAGRSCITDSGDNFTSFGFKTGDPA